MRKLTSGLVVLIGALWTFNVLPLVVNAGKIYFRSGDTPVSTKVAGAADERWIRLEDARPRCDTRTVHRRSTFFLADPAEGGAPFVVQLNGEVPCEAGTPLVGGFVPGRYSRAWVKENAGLDVPGEGDLRLFSEALSPRSIRGVLLLGVALLVAGVAVLATGVRRLRRAFREPPAPR